MIEPRLLSKGDRIAIVAPAGNLSQDGIDRAAAVLTSWGLKIVKGRFLYGQHGYFAGTDNERLADLQNAIDDPTIAAILIARGGYGTTRILDRINLESLKISPKWLIGFSDITALHLKMLLAGFISIHGDVGTTMGRDESATEQLMKLLFEGSSHLESSEPLRAGLVEAQLVGGNLSLIVDSLGTASEVETNGRILVLEEIDEKTYRIDRMLHQLDRAGKLNHLAGLVLGHFTQISDGSSSFGGDWKTCVKDVIEHYKYPVAYGFKIGHEPENYPLLHGANYRFEVTAEQADLSRITS
jgi:muramoyltetrapeptide carboxypeptidase